MRQFLFIYCHQLFWLWLWTERKIYYKQNEKCKSALFTVAQLKAKDSNLFENLVWNSANFKFKKKYFVTAVAESFITQLKGGQIRKNRGRENFLYREVRHPKTGKTLLNSKIRQKFGPNLFGNYMNRSAGFARIYRPFIT